MHQGRCRNRQAGFERTLLVGPARRLARCAGVVAGLGVLGAAPQASQAQEASPVIAPAASAQSFTGREFAGVRFSGEVQHSDLRIAGRRAWVWAESTTGVPGAAACERLLLRGDVDVQLGTYHFTAAQATVWVQRQGAGRSQIAIYFDRVSDPGARAGFSQAADRLLVTALIDGAVAMRSDTVDAVRPGAPFDALVSEGEARLAQELLRATGQGGVKAASPDAGAPARAGIDPGLSRPFEPNSPLSRSGATVIAPAPIAPGDSTDALFTSDGIVTFAVGTNRAPGPTPQGQEEIKIIRGGTNEDGTAQDNSLLLSGGVVVQYQDVRQTRNLQISAQRAVVFLSPGPLTEMTRFSIKDVKGIYVEGDVVATDGQYTLRGPRVFYDVQKNQALMVDAVFFTYDTRIQAPIYVRAKELRQRAANQFSATDARLAATSFFDPVMSVGASSITITQSDNPASAGGQAQGGKRSYLVAKNLTLRFADVPFFWMPGYRGDVENVPLEDLRVENSSGSGTALKTGWNVFGLLGLDRPDGLRSRLLLDYYFDRGPALGNQTSWDYPRHEGDLFGYILPDDQGEDVLSSGLRRGHDGDVRGIIIGKDRWTIDPNWTLFSEGNYISDENFVDAFFRSIAVNERELTNSLYLRYLDDNTGATLQAKGTFNDFTVNQYLLTSQGYTVDKLPEAQYFRLADDLIGQSAPGLLTWTHEYRASRMRLNFTEPTASELGFNSLGRSRAAFGLTPSETLADGLRAAGLSESDVLRFDTRQELASTLDFYWFKATPFVVGRATVYDEGFEDFSGKDDTERFFYAAGTRFSTQITRVYDDAESAFFDVHRLRHIIEPNLTVYYAGSTLNQTELPVYDERVESLATGSVVKAGINQTLQTQRGGPGRWRNVDWLTFDAEVVYSTDDADRESPVGRFFDYRPEYSLLGDYATIDTTWQVTDAVSLSANYVYDLDIHQPARSSAGGMIQHTPDFATYAEVRYINALDSTLVDGGIAYDLTRRYSATASATYDTDRNELQSVGGTLRRKMRESVIGFSLRYDNIRSETSFGLVIEPTIGSAAQRGLRLREVGR